MLNGNLQTNNSNGEPSKSIKITNQLTCSSSLSSSTSSSLTTTAAATVAVAANYQQNEFQAKNSSSSSPNNLHHINNCQYASGASSSLPALYDNSSMTDVVVIDDYNQNEPTSTILNYCKRKFLRPYILLLGLVGLHPNATDITCCGVWYTNIHSCFVFILLCLGYVLQYLSSFRRDRGFTLNDEFNNIVPVPPLLHIEPVKYFVETNLTTTTSDLNSTLLWPTITNIDLNSKLMTVYNFGEIFFVYLIPSILHCLGYLTAIYVFRIVDNEQLQNLVERVFLISSHTNEYTPKRLCIRLWLYVISNFIWLLLLLAYLIFSILNHTNNFHFLLTISNTPTHIQYTIKILLVITIFIHDLCQMVILTSYCIECYLLRLHLYNLKEKLVQHTIESIDWMREILEFRKLLTHLNHHVATPVCLFTILNLSYGFAGIIYLLKEYDFDSPIKLFSLNIISIIIWLIIGLLPFFQAANITHECRIAQASGHQIRVRPFVYDNATDNDLNSTLLFASSLQMSAKLFKMPIQSNYLYFTILIISLIILTLGMCLNVTLNIQ